MNTAELGLCARILIDFYNSARIGLLYMFDLWSWAPWVQDLRGGGASYATAPFS